MYLVVSTSLNSESRTRRLARSVSELIRERTGSVDLLDLSSLNLPLDTGQTRNDETVRKINQRLGPAAGIVFVLPIYRCDVAVSARNLVQLSGRGLQRKVIGLASVAGDSLANVSTLSFANSLMLEHKAFVIPDFVLLKSDSLSETAQQKGIVSQQITRMVDSLIRVTEALSRA